MLAPIVLLLLPSSAAAQTKISGVVHCNKPTVTHVLPVGDRPDHSFAISKGSCTWEKPLQLEGAQMKTDESTGFSELTGNTSSDRFFIISTLSTGAKAFVRVQGTSTLTNGAFQGGGGTWTYEGGTGTFTKLTGKGTFKCRANPDGTSTCDVEGEYRLSK